MTSIFVSGFFGREFGEMYIDNIFQNLKTANFTPKSTQHSIFSYKTHQILKLPIMQAL